LRNWRLERISFTAGERLWRKTYTYPIPQKGKMMH
jgi:hypothetical protein